MTYNLGWREYIQGTAIHQSPEQNYPNAFQNQRKQSKTNKGGEAYYKPQHDPVLDQTKNTLITIRNKSTSRSRHFTLFSQGNTKVLAMSQEGGKK